MIRRITSDDDDVWQVWKRACQIYWQVGNTLLVRTWLKNSWNSLWKGGWTLPLASKLTPLLSSSVLYLVNVTTSVLANYWTVPCGRSIVSVCKLRLPLAEGRRGPGDRIWPMLPLNTAALHAQTQLLWCSNIPPPPPTSRLTTILG